MSRHVHILGICGYATSGLALLAQELGDTVTGSDDHTYPPLSDVITAAGIDWAPQSDPANLDRWGVPDLVVVGNQTREDNPELAEVRARGIAALSEIEFYALTAGARLRLTVCGTHGKTTTASLLVHMLATAGFDPGFRLGSTSIDAGNRSAALGSGPFVFEGDEYTTAPWDRSAKFLHTHPAGACVTRLELDHPDVYPTLDAYRAPFQELVAALPADGVLALCSDDAEAVRLRDRASCRVVTYGGSAGADWRIDGIRDDAGRQRFSVHRSDAPPLDVVLTFPGAHNAANACAALILAGFAGVPEAAALQACASFRGPARRFEVLRDDPSGIAVVDDYAHHPTEVAAALAAARQRYGRRRIIAVHTPHTFSRTRALLEDYAHAFSAADLVVLGPIEAARERGLAALVSSDDVATRVRDRSVSVVPSSDAALDLVCRIARAGDVVLVLSLGGFDKLAPRLAAALEAVHAG
jgi:UDP-N-acetylmuramate--L-alanine ligase